MSSILLLNPKISRCFDDAGVAVTKSIVGQSRSAYPYEQIAGHQQKTASRQIHSLMYYCIKILMDYAGELHVLGATRLTYNHSSELLQLLIPSWGTPDFTLRQIDPRLWAVLVQLFKGLPSELLVYPIALSDPNLIRLQRIQSSPDFAMITILDLNHCAELCDETLMSLKELHNLTCFDCGRTQVTSYGLNNFSRTQGIDEIGGRRGPGALRILRLRNCTKIDDSIHEVLDKFLLLCAVGKPALCSIEIE